MAKNFNLKIAPFLNWKCERLCCSFQFNSIQFLYKFCLVFCCAVLSRAVRIISYIFFFSPYKNIHFYILIHAIVQSTLASLPQFIHFICTLAWEIRIVIIYYLKVIRIGGITVYISEKQSKRTKRNKWNEYCKSLYIAYLSKNVKIFSCLLKWSIRMPFRREKYWGALLGNGEFGGKWQMTSYIPCFPFFLAGNLQKKLPFDKLMRIFILSAFKGKMVLRTFIDSLVRWFMGSFGRIKTLENICRLDKWEIYGRSLSINVCIWPNLRLESGIECFRAIEWVQRAS